MAVSKLWKVTERLGQVIDYAANTEKTSNPKYSSEEYQALKDVLTYAKNEEKTESTPFPLQTVSGCKIRRNLGTISGILQMKFVCRITFP